MFIKPVTSMIVLLASLSGCSKAPEADLAKSEQAQAAQKTLSQPARKSVAAPAAQMGSKVNEPLAGASRVIAKTDIGAVGSSSCKIDFVYAGSAPEDLFWDGEDCDEVTAKLVDQAELEKLGRWQRLDDFDKRFVREMPGGKVLYVEGASTASIYPIGTTNMSYEVELERRRR